MSQRSRQRLLADAEKLYAGDQLWRAYGDRHGAPAPVLGRAIKTYVARTGAGGGADVIRAFFRRHIGDLGALLPYVEQCSRQEEADSSALAEANDIVLVSPTSPTLAVHA
jgi:nuclear pore complex protein Nup133